MPRQRLRRTALAHGQIRRIYLRSYQPQIEAHTRLESIFRFHNEQRPHSALGNAEPMTQMEVYRHDQRHALSA